METASNVQVREHNRALVRRELLRLRHATKPQLAAATGLSQMTVGSVVSALLNDGEAEAGELVPSGGGRPSVGYRYRGEAHKAAVLYSYQKQGGSFVRLLVCDLFGDVVYRESRTFSSIREDSFDSLLACAFREAEGIGAIALGLPGQAVDGEIVGSDHPALVGKRLLRRYEARYGVPVRFVNDVNATVWGRRVREEGPARETLAAVYFPERYPPGLGLLVDGRLHTGHGNYVGELQYLPIGVDWTALDYGDWEAVEGAVVKLISAACALAGPDRFLLYGEFFRPGMAERIREAAEARFPAGYGMEVEAFRDLGPDYEAGMRSLALQTLKRSLWGAGGIELC